MRQSTTRKETPALVVGLDGMNGIQTVRILASHGVPVFAIAKDRRHYAAKTRLCEEIYFADTKSDELIEALQAIGRRMQRKTVLFPCHDMEVSIISRHRALLSPWFHIRLPPHSTVETLMNKVEFYEFAIENGLPIPETRVISSLRDVENAAQDLTFPCILKPPISAAPRWETQSRLKAYRIGGPKQLVEAYERYANLSDTFVVQEWVPGPISNLYSCNLYFNSSSDALVTFVSKKIRQWPPITGESSLGIECKNEVVLKEALRLFGLVSYAGLAYLEMKQHETTGEHYIIEPNIGRPTGRSPIAEAGGVELVYTMYCDAVGLPLPKNRIQKYGDVKWIYLRRDFQSALHAWRQGDLSLRDWAKTWQGRKAFALYSREDPMPFILDLTRSVRLFLSAEERKKRDYRDEFA